MDLFIINRYDEKRNAEEETELEQKRLEKILKKAKKRKLKLIQSQQDNLEQDKNFDETKEILDENNQIDESSTKKTPEINETNKAHDNKSKNEHLRDHFQILGTNEFLKKRPVKRVLPKWLAHPTIVSSNLKDSKKLVTEIETLHPFLKKSLIKNGIEYLFPIQAEVIPFIIEENEKLEPYWPQDVCISATTGSGKTLAFALPIIQKLLTRIVVCIRALVILPVRELALQVYKVFAEYVKGTSLKVAVITGTLSFAAEQELLVSQTITQGYISNVDILISTPGRLVDHIAHTPGLNFNHLEFLVMDEADRLINNAPNDWLFHLSHHLPNWRDTSLNVDTLLNKKRPPQKILSSATLTQDPDKIYQIGLFQPRLFTCTAKHQNELNVKELRGDFVGKYTTPEELQEKYVKCELMAKPLIVYLLLKQFEFKRVFIFTGSGVETHRLSILLNELAGGEFKVSEISSKLDNSIRAKNFREFLKGDRNILVSTDALARGIDLPNIDCVISYNAPKHLKTYIHRVGRTGRAGKQGTAITLVMEKQLERFHKMFEKKENSRSCEEIQIEDINKYDEVYEKALKNLKISLEKEKSSNLSKVNKVRLVVDKKKVFFKKFKRRKVSKTFSKS